jgi:ATP adenylyltransferase/5',5'''-P-1,P-4-tetraphosphate phosphorylase II
MSLRRELKWVEATLCSNSLLWLVVRKYPGSKPFRSNQSNKQVNEKQKRYESREKDHIRFVLDFLTRLHKKKASAHRHQTKQKHCWQPNFELHGYYIF